MAKSTAAAPTAQSMLDEATGRLGTTSTQDHDALEANAAAAGAQVAPPDFPDSPAAGKTAEDLEAMTDAERAALLAAHQAHIAPQVEAAFQGMQTYTYPDGSARHGCPPFPKESPIQQQQREHREAQEAEDPSLIGLAERQQANANLT